MDLSNLSLAELHALQPKIQDEIKKRQADVHAKARQQILQIAQDAGLPLKDLLNSGFKMNKGGGEKKHVEAKYKNPADNSQTWTGRGRQPKWVKEWTDAGKSMDALKI